MVYAFAHSERDSDMSVINDDEQGARLAIEHLLQTGRTRIAHVTGPAHHVSAQLRARGAAAALADAGGELVLEGPLWGNWSEAWGRDAVGVLHRAGVTYDAIFCGSDQIARGVLEVLRETGRSVPDEVGVVGFDNWEVMATGGRPPLTTVDLNLSELGRYAAQRLLNAIDGQPEPGVHTLPCELIVRESTAITSRSTTASRRP